MSVYTVYTRTVHIPSYVLFKCPKCGNAVVCKGSYDVASSYSNQGTWTKRGVEKRKAKSDDYLLSQISEESEKLKASVIPVGNDYRRVHCTCPCCGHSSLSKFADKKKVKDRLFWITLLSVLLLLTVVQVVSNSFHLGATLLGTVVIAGIASIFGEGILDIVENTLAKSSYKDATPMLSANRRLLKEKAASMPVYHNVDFTPVMEMPVILDIKNSDQQDGSSL